jgi:hypothetical protein
MSHSPLIRRASHVRIPAWREEMMESIHENQMSRRRFLGRAAAAVGTFSLVGGLSQIEAYAQEAAAVNASKAIVPGRSPLKITKLETFIHRNSWVFVKISTDAGIVGWGEMLVLVVILGFYYRHVIERLISIWSNNGDWSHGFIIPLFSAYYLYLQRDRFPFSVRTNPWPARIAGAMLLAAAFLLYVYSTLVLRQEYPKTVSLIMSIMGAILMVFGWPVAR